jgi:hypothetical protein
MNSFETTLLEAHKLYEPLCISDPELANKLCSQLETIGCAQVFLEPQTPSMKPLVLNLMKLTFPLVQKENISDFCNVWNKESFETTQVWGKSIGMPYPPILTTGDRVDFTHPVTEIVHSYNPLVAKNAILIWEELIKQYPLIQPSKWFDKECYYRTHVSEDGIKITHKKKYSATPLHYDGQVPYDRIQIIYNEDVGPTTLCFVPGSHLLNYTSTGFVKEKNPELYNLLTRYGITYDRPCIQFFKGSVFHYECNPDKTKETSVFRCYMSVVRIPVTEERIRDMIILAYMREHGWVMESFSKENKNNRRDGLFVNDKSNSSGIVFHDYQEYKADFAEIRKQNMNVMKMYLKQHCDTLRLNLYGLNIKDL